MRRFSSAYLNALGKPLNMPFFYLGYYINYKTYMQSLSPFFKLRLFI